jgi:hypothetical protein
MAFGNAAIPIGMDHGLAPSGEGGNTRMEEASEGSRAARRFAYAEIGSSEAIG